MTNELRANIEALPTWVSDDGRKLLVAQSAVLALLPTPTAPQETAGETVAICKTCGGSFSLSGSHDCPGLFAHPTPAAAPTDNTALVEAARFAKTMIDHFIHSEEGIAPLEEAHSRLSAALASRPGEATSREGVEGEYDGLVKAHLSKVDGTVRGSFHRETADAITALQAKLAEVEAELRATAAERDRAMKACEQIGAQVTAARAAALTLLCQLDAHQSNTEEYLEGDDWAMVEQIRSELAPAASDAAQQGES